MITHALGHMYNYTTHDARLYIHTIPRPEPPKCRKLVINTARKSYKNMVKVRLSVDNTKQFKTIAMNEQILECGNLRVSLCKQPL